VKLYSEDLSPFSAPVRLAIYAKGLDIPIGPPPGGPRSEAYTKVSLTGLVPCLILDDGTPLPESMVILDYLEDRFPTPPLKPAGPEARAREALIRRFAETELLVAQVELFHKFGSDEVAAAAALALAHFERGLGLIQGLMADDGFIAGPDLTTADCVLIPALMGLAMVAPVVGRPALVADHPKIAAYVARAQQHPAAVRVLGELQAAVAASGLSLG